MCDGVSIEMYTDRTLIILFMYIRINCVRRLLCEEVIGKHSISQVAANFLKSGNLNGHFTNHSLRHTSATRLFQTGVDRKLVREFTGHICNAI